MELRFDQASRDSRTHTNLSAIRRDETGLWVAGDETATIEHLTWTGDHFGAQRGFRLADFVDLPAGPDDEADIEGLARHDGHLWAIGSHSLKRRRVKTTRNQDKGVRRLATVLREENRFILVRLPLDAAANSPAKGAIMSGRTENLAYHLRDDPHLAPFLALPGKDNGLDIEGIAVTRHGVHLGLRGPVLRGWAVVLEIHPEVDGPRMRLRRPYRKHFLDLGGLGVRDMCPFGDDLLLLTGPSMDLDGPVRLVRWNPRTQSGLVDDLQVLAELPHGIGCDHPEGLTLLPDGRVMVVYDSPSPARMTEHGVYADILTI
ncbi:MAG: DUF3616 domain-containing protein [Thermoactinospora sp.]|nr:DUF3616 domain-containing protein [Thermoactinospora sp.]